MTVFTAVNMPRLRDDMIRSLGVPQVWKWLAGAANQASEIRHPDGTTGRVDRVKVGADDIARWLRVAELFFVTEPMTAVAAQAAQSLPGYRLHRDDLPATVGLLVWAAPVAADRVVSDGGVQGVATLQGVLWAPTETRVGPGVAAVLFCDTDTLLTSSDYGASLTPATRGRMRADIGPLCFYDTVPLVYGDAEDIPVGNHEVAAVLSTWLLTGQRIALIEREPLPRQMRRQYTRGGRPEPLVRSITLRRATSPHHPDVDGQGPSREFHHQWIVSGHWRNAWYPSRGEHRPVYIAAYVKGPEGAPMIGGQRVNVLRR